MIYLMCHTGLCKFEDNQGFCRLSENVLDEPDALCVRCSRDVERIKAKINKSSINNKKSKKTSSYNFSFDNQDDTGIYE